MVEPAWEPHDLRGMADAAWHAVDPELRSRGGELALETPNSGEAPERQPAPAAFDPAPSILHCDGERMTMALRNIFENALHARPDATVRVQALRHRESGGVDSGTLLRVIDNGPGVPAQELPRLFERFYRSPANRAPGSGLGLSIVEGVAKLHGGAVRAYNRSAAGSTTGLVIEIMIPDPHQ